MIAGLLVLTACSPAARFTSNSESEINNSEISTARYLPGEILTGTASYYAHEFHGRKTANGEIFDMNGLTAASPDLPFNLMLKITNRKNGLQTVVRVNDRMPRHPSRLLDLSLGAAKALGMVTDGLAEVTIEILSIE